MKSHNLKDDGFLGQLQMTSRALFSMARTFNIGRAWTIKLNHFGHFYGEDERPLVIMEGVYSKAEGVLLEMELRRVLQTGLSQLFNVWQTKHGQIPVSMRI